MKFVILSLSTGGGHNAAAEAICQALQNEGAEAKVYDGLGIISPMRSRMVCGTYVGLARHSPRLFGVIYNLSFHITSRRRKSVVYAANIQSAGKLADFLDTEKPDGVIATHIFCVQQLTYLRRHHRLSVWSAGVITDYDLQPFWNEEELDCVFTPSEDISELYARNGLPREILKSVGIPVDPMLTETTDLRAAKKDAGLDPDRRHAVVAGGSMGAGSMYPVIRTLVDILPADVQIVAACGNNRALIQRLEKLSLPEERLKILGFLRPLHRLIRAADVLVSKPGGLSSTEAFAQRVPIVAAHPIAGVESNNAAYMQQKGVALCPETDVDIAKAAARLLSDPALVERMKAAQRALVPGSASREIARACIEACGGKKA